MAELPDHSIGTKFLWKGRGKGEKDIVMTVIKVTKRTVKMRAHQGWTCTFREKHRALTCGTLVRLSNLRSV